MGLLRDCGSDEPVLHLAALRVVITTGLQAARDLLLLTFSAQAHPRSTGEPLPRGRTPPSGDFIGPIAVFDDRQWDTNRRIYRGGAVQNKLTATGERPIIKHHSPSA